LTNVRLCYLKITIGIKSLLGNRKLHKFKKKQEEEWRKGSFAVLVKAFD